MNTTGQGKAGLGLLKLEGGKVTGQVRHYLTFCRVDTSLYKSLLPTRSSATPEVHIESKVQGQAQSPEFRKASLIIPVKH
jgi:hypothetical protein